MLSLGLIISLLSLSISFKPELAFPKDDNLIVLSELTIDEAMRVYDSLFIFFNSDWCISCPGKLQEYKELAAAFANKSFDATFAVINTGTYSHLNTRFGIPIYSNIIFIYQGINTGIYDSEMSYISMSLYAREKQSQPTNTMLAKKKIEKKRFNNEEVLVYFGNNDQDIQAITKILFDHSYISFVTCDCDKDNDVMFFYKVNKPRTLMIFTTYGDQRYELVLDNETKQSQIKQFIIDYAHPVIMNLYSKSSNLLFREERSAIVMIRSPDASRLDENAKLEKAFTTLGSEFKGKILFVNIQTYNSLKEYLITQFNIIEKDLPTIRIYDPINNMRFVPFKHGYDVNSMTIEIDEVIKQNPIPRLETLIDLEEKSHVCYLDSESFHKIVNNPEYDVLVNFYDLTSKNSKLSVPMYEKLAKRFADNPKVIIANIDGTLNPIPNILIDAYPMFIFYPAGVIGKHYSVDRGQEYSFEAFEQFILTYAANLNR